MDIFGPPTASFADILTRSAGAKDVFLKEMAPASWFAAVTHGIDPVVQIAQMAHETGWGAFPGNVRPWFFNPCGLKIRNPGEIPATTGDQPYAHAQFGSWMAGCVAHSQHLLGYARRPQNPGEPILSARLVWINSPIAVTTVEGLSGRWAPSATYGDRVVVVAKKLQGLV